MIHVLLPVLLLLAHMDGEPDAAWFRSLKIPGTKMMCCTDKDCRNVEVRYRGGQREVFISRRIFLDDPTNDDQGHAPDAWVVVPESRVLHVANPTGAPMACWYERKLRCFVDGPET